ncbi:hypothetical protein H4W80_009520 [Nonomuraea angiospora]|uniref:Uncharacterized protein n=1 Tax=Nonomuraea angiospora TaxID=46172 RepID=A0ABR9MEC9_9ACTN|nr:hypothetical protein [Nonomuraea angiospora]
MPPAKGRGLTVMMWMSASRQGLTHGLTWDTHRDHGSRRPLGRAGRGGRNRHPQRPPRPGAAAAVVCGRDRCFDRGGEGRDAGAAIGCGGGVRHAIQSHGRFDRGGEGRDAGAAIGCGGGVRHAIQSHACFDRGGEGRDAGAAIGCGGGVRHAIQPHGRFGCDGHIGQPSSFSRRHARNQLNSHTTPGMQPGFRCQVRWLSSSGKPLRCPRKGTKSGSRQAKRGGGVQWISESR